MEASRNNGTRSSEKEVTESEIDILVCYQRGVGGASVWILLFSHVRIRRGMLSRGKRQDLTAVTCLTCFAGLGRIMSKVANRFLVPKAFTWIMG